MEIFARVAVRQLLGVFFLSCLFVTNVQAAVQGIEEEDYPVTQSKKEKDDIPLGVHAGVAADYKLDSNIYRSETKEVDDRALSLIPSLLYKGEIAGRHPYSLNFVGEFARYRKYSTEDFNDVYSMAKMTLDVTRKLNINLKANYISSHDARAVPASRIKFDLRPDKWQVGRLFAEVVYGRRTNKAQLKAFVEGIRRPYTNNDQQTRSRNRMTGGAIFFYNMRPKTSLLAAVSFSNIDYYYGATPIDLSSLETNLSLGIKWEATAKTTGQIRVGYLVKNLYDGNLQDYGGISIKATILWEPKTYSRLKLLVQRRTDESIELASSYFVTTRLATSWEHDLTDSATFAFMFDGQNDKYSYERNDNLEDFGLDFKYEMNKRLDIGFRYVRSLKTSNLVDTNYSANILIFRVAMKTL